MIISRPGSARHRPGGSGMICTTINSTSALIRIRPVVTDRLRGACQPRAKNHPSAKTPAISTIIRWIGEIGLPPPSNSARHSNPAATMKSPRRVV